MFSWFDRSLLFTGQCSVRRAVDELAAAGAARVLELPCLEEVDHCDLPVGAFHDLSGEHGQPAQDRRSPSFQPTPRAPLSWFS